jgi:hypothetical protein
MPSSVIHHFNPVPIRVPKKAAEFAIILPGFPIKGNAYASQVGHPCLPVFHLHGKVVGFVGPRISPLHNVKLRVSQLQIPRMFLRPFRIEHLFVPLLAPLNVTGGHVRMLDATDPNAVLGYIGWNILEYRGYVPPSNYLQWVEISQTKLGALRDPLPGTALTIKQSPEGVKGVGRPERSPLLNKFNELSMN